MTPITPSGGAHSDDAANRPYYEDEWVTLYHGDARDVLPQLPHAHGIVTDPPYGVGFVYDGYEDTSEAWTNLMNEIVPLLRAHADFVVMPSCAVKRMGWWYANHPPDWLIAWYKGSPGHAARWPLYPPMPEIVCDCEECRGNV